VDVVKTNGTALDSLTWDIVRLEIDNLKRLQNIYEKTSAKMNDQFEKLEIAKEDLKECQGKLN
jgi:FtsZ-binding cell division protein ZapB